MDDEDFDDEALLQAALEVDKILEDQKRHSISLIDKKCENESEDGAKASTSDPSTGGTHSKEPLNSGFFGKDSKVLKCLKRYFGHSQFRECQEKVVEAALSGRDQLVVMATGSGKSLCYQFPAVFRDSLTLVISPLLSLMEDQVKNLELMGIKAGFLGSSQPNPHLIYDELRKSELRVLYITPEYASSSGLNLEDFSEDLKLIAIDEAHCISQWGHDFRSFYRHLGDLRQKFQNIPFMALTATATETVRKDIVKNLHLRNPLVTCTSFDRPNLFLCAQKKTNINSDFTKLLKYDKRREPPGFGGSTIIYCPTKKMTEDVSDELTNMGVRNVTYHAGMSVAGRRNAHKSFSGDKVPVVVATVAFGMGIDKPDIRNIIHYGAPKDVESYYQEIGRGGRDGERSVCTVLFSDADFAKNRTIFLKDMRNEEFKKHKVLMMKHMEDCLTGESCRRRAILEYFESKDRLSNSKENQTLSSNCCDICKKRVENPNDKSSNERDFGEQAEMLLKVIHYVLKDRFGLVNCIKFLRGTKMTSNVFPRLLEHELHGKGKGKSEVYWKALGQMLKSKGYINLEPIPGNVMGLSAVVSKLGLRFLEKCSVMGKSGTLNMVPSTDLIESERTSITVGGASVDGKLPVSAPSRNFNLNEAEVSSVPVKQLGKTKINKWLSLEELGFPPLNSQSGEGIQLSGPEEELMKAMKGLRLRLAEETEVAPYMIASEKALIQLCKQRPDSVERLLDLEEWPEERVNKFGQQFVEKMKGSCSENQLNVNVSSPQTVQDIFDQFPLKQKDKLKDLKEASFMSYRFHVEGKTNQEIATKRERSVGTVLNHLTDAAKLGLPLRTSLLSNLKEETISEVLEVIRSPSLKSGIAYLKPIKESFPDPEQISYDELKIILGILEYEYGVELKTPKLPSLPTSAVTLNPGVEEKTDESGKRRLPGWMQSQSTSSNQQKSAPPPVKKMKSKSSVFR